ncbi:hypothetical protein P152DRAFT_480448 [Eremomyces bilateralis CBS 781.70]|uniref:P-loop containing nucleoside triphosphate hydrolase protein n=1 Tax=Eremomyces bilateralis CBS 781.70 TaxID=1392243 RepID=A0A6G1G8I4_9PEZI|nr:uncharacterized protein P152DRAFT_480448 [Eremomyces bilateralis CBS 781.70]KAF1814236.1 hypothetical protein P152DRAFT_480448 [Eremomyces bilateralis CBS 781.70]
MQVAADALLVECVVTKTDNLPLAMLFAGAPGSGKSELAIKFGPLYGMSTMRISCAETTATTETLFESGPVIGSSLLALNDFLSENQGQRSIVVLERIENASKGFQAVILAILSSGEAIPRPPIRYLCALRPRRAFLAHLVIVPFFCLIPPQQEQIVVLELNKLAKRAAMKASQKPPTFGNVQLKILDPKAVIAYILDAGYTEEGGARSI